MSAPETDLRALAEAALAAASTTGWYDPELLECALASEVDNAFVAACSPERIIALLDESVRLREALDVATRDTQRLRDLDAQVRGDALGHVTLTANDGPPMRTVNVYLGDASIPIAVGGSLSESIDVMREALARDHDETVAEWVGPKWSAP